MHCSYIGVNDRSIRINNFYQSISIFTIGLARKRWEGGHQQGYLRGQHLQHVVTPGT